MIRYKTLVVQIGNSDDKLSQKEWSLFVMEMNHFIEHYCGEVHFSGGSDCSKAWQNYCWVGVFDAVQNSIELIKLDIREMRLRYKQDSVAVVIGESLFL